MNAAISLALALGLLFTFSGCTETEPKLAATAKPTPQAAADREPTVVTVATVANEALTGRIAASGSLTAARVTELGAESPGRILEVLVDIGDTVEPGQILFRVDPVPYQTALAEARAGLQLARSEQTRAEAEAERMRRLAEQNIVPEQRHEKHQTEAEVARARVAQMRARVARAQLDLEHTEGAAPYAGSVVERSAHEGALAGPGTNILVLAETSRLKAVLDVPEVTPVPVRVGDEVRVWIEGSPRPFETRIDRVNRRLDPETRTYAVRAPVSDTKGLLKAGSYARAEILSRRVDPQPVVPRTALLSRDGRTYAVLVQDQRARRVPVRTGLRVGDRVEILDGLGIGDRVVVGDDVERIEDGEALVAGNGDGAGLSAVSAPKEPGS
ncbi:MAG: efflux RND transporter periplasmic adaptor subunit [Myxococcota bacterium]|nr:efflux RND transporter periplasmic adaptor subunit [Myxococcota bacterium]